MEKKKQTKKSSLKDFEFVKDLIELLEEHKIAEFSYQKDDFKVEIRRKEKATAAVGVPSVSSAHPFPSHFQLNPSLVSGAVDSEKKAEDKSQTSKNLYEITSPIIGTFYEAPAPGEAPFVEVGDRITPDTVVCIVEAMKLMNKIKAGVSGVIKEKLVKNEESVQQGQVLFRVELI